MFEALITAEVVLGACVGLAAAFLAVIFVRRRFLARSGELLMCALRVDERARWRGGLLRLDDHVLLWFPLFGVSLRAAHGWRRENLELGTFHRLAEDSAVPDSDGTGVHVHLVGEPTAGRLANVELSLGVSPYTALRSWLEASPPGRRPVDW